MNRLLPSGSHGLAAELQEMWDGVYRTPDGVPEVTVAWVRRHGHMAHLVDVREPDEFVGELGHVAGSELVPLGRVEEEADAWDRERPLVLICRSGGRSGDAATALEAMGFRRVVSMAGGMIEWNERGWEIERA
ncbi:MAG: rhodanese-like domain-containing protein [Myxococcota bacterium]